MRRAADRSWFQSEIHPHEPGLRAFLKRHFPTVPDIDDLVQEAYERLFRARSRGTVANARSFLYTAAKNLACDHFRRSRSVAVADVEALAISEETPDAAESLSRAQELAILGEAIASLPPRCRDVFTLRRLHELSYAEISERLGISEHTINAQLAIGIARCRSFLLERGVIMSRTAAKKIA